jgi:hypothetical protein
MCWASFGKEEDGGGLKAAFLRSFTYSSYSGAEQPMSLVDSGPEFPRIYRRGGSQSQELCKNNGGKLAGFAAN